jgi:hypothetical protein
MRMGKKKSEICPKGKNPADCTPEQIAECHPERKNAHPCEKRQTKLRRSAASSNTQ